MTVLWFIAWLIANAVGDKEPLLFDPVNVWTALLILTIALDINRPQVVWRGNRGRSPRTANAQDRSLDR